MGAFCLELFDKIRSTKGCDASGHCNEHIFRVTCHGFDIAESAVLSLIKYFVNERVWEFL